ncbi:MAG: D-alanyl-D-alanine carboxypeptidase [Rhodospirillales bacterium]|nr:D-alanyl-D-alanine carboxypeptidase [Rhodospirillales bacterium]
MGWGALRVATRGSATWLGLALLAALSLGATPARAQIGSARFAEIVMVASTGRVLSATNPDAPRIPASLTKMMTLYMTFEALRDRRISLNEQVPVSEHCASVEPVKLGLIPGVTRITVQDAILGMVTLSANDAACAMGEMLAGGSEARFAQMMTLRARGLGMTHTIYRNASGLPTPQNITTVRDLATLARHLIYDFPAYYHYFSVRNFVFNGRTIFGHDDLLGTYPGVDGLKTGYTDLSGFNLATSAVRGGVRLIGIVVGFTHPDHRDADMRSLLNAGFRDVGVLPGRSPGLRLVTPAVAATMPHPLPPHPAVPRRAVMVAAAATPRPVLRPAPPPAAPANWLVNVGAYSSWPAAQHAAILAHNVLGSGSIRVVPAGTPAHRLWGAQLTGFSYGSAEGACHTLSQHRLPCEAART